MLEDANWLPKIKTHISNRRAKGTRSIESEDQRTESTARVFMDRDELRRTRHCHQPSVRLMLDLLGRLPKLDFTLALDAGCGDGMFTADCLASKFKVVDMLDPCPVAISKVKTLKVRLPAIDRVTRASMQEYQWRKCYNCIVLRWSAGYLDDEELVTFLEKARKQLAGNPARPTRSYQPSSCVFVLDNVLWHGQIPFTKDGQRVRAEATLEGIFREAGLHVAAKTPAMPLH